MVSLGLIAIAAGLLLGCIWIKECFDFVFKEDHRYED